MTTLTEDQKKALIAQVNIWLIEQSLVGTAGILEFDLRLKTELVKDRVILNEGLDRLLATPIGTFIRESVFVTRKGQLLKILERHGYNTLGQVARQSEWEFSKMRDMGRKKIRGLRDALILLGLDFGTQAPVGPLEKAVLATFGK